MIQSNKKIQAGWEHGGSYQICIFRVFFSFNAVASPDYISLQARRVRPGGGVGVVKANFIFLSWGTVGGRGVQNKFGGSRQINIFFSITSVRITFLVERRSTFSVYVGLSGFLYD